MCVSKMELMSVVITLISAIKIYAISVSNAIVLVNSSLRYQETVKGHLAYTLINNSIHKRYLNNTEVTI